MIAIGNTFDHVEIKKELNGYFAEFKLNGLSYYLCRQRRMDRQYDNPLRVFRTLDTAVSKIRDTDYTGVIVINESDEELCISCYKLLDNLQRTNLGLLQACMSKINR